MKQAKSCDPLLISPFKSTLEGSEEEMKGDSKVVCSSLSKKVLKSNSIFGRLFLILTFVKAA